MTKIDVNQRVPAIKDLLLAGAFFVAAAGFSFAFEQIGTEGFGWFSTPLWMMIGATGLGTLPLAYRRIFPLGSLLLIAAGSMFVSLARISDFGMVGLAGVIALISAGIHGRSSVRNHARALYAVIVILGVVSASLDVFSSLSNPMFDSGSWPFVISFYNYLYLFGSIAGSWYIGDVERKRRLVAGDLEDRNQELEDALEQIHAQAANEERLSIARDVHDIVGHSVSLFGIQAAAARRQISHDPAAAEDILRTMEDHSRHTVEELRGLITVLRGSPHDDTDETHTSPTPSLEKIDGLVERIQEAGRQITYDRTGPEPHIAAVGVSGYRIVQEAVSNAIKHGAGDIDVMVISDARQVRISVSNETPEGADVLGQESIGSGLRGIRERTNLHKGTFKVEHNGDGRFLLEVVLPLPKE